MKPHWISNIESKKLVHCSFRTNGINTNEWNVLLHFDLLNVNRNMLSAAHVLAMDAKNLLDVVDSVRIRYPDLFSVESAQRMAASKQCEASDEFYLRNSDEYDAEKLTSDNLSSFPNVSSTSGSINYSDNCGEQQTYQNLCKSFEQPPTSFIDEIYVNQIEPVTVNTVAATNTTGSSEGIYDNECIVNAQLKNLHIDSRIANSFANTSSAVNPSNKVTPPVSSTKPPLAAKPGKIPFISTSVPLYISWIERQESLFILSFQSNRVIYNKRSKHSIMLACLYVQWKSLYRHP